MGAEFSAVGAEFSAVVGAEFPVGPSSPRANFSMGTCFGLGRVLRGAEFSGIRLDNDLVPTRQQAIT